MDLVINVAFFFGFEPNSENETKDLLKVCTVQDDAVRNRLSQAPITTLHVERSVGEVNYELDIPGKKSTGRSIKKVSNPKKYRSSFFIVVRQTKRVKKARECGQRYQIGMEM